MQRKTKEFRRANILIAGVRLAKAVKGVAKR